MDITYQFLINNVKISVWLKYIFLGLLSSLCSFAFVNLITKILSININNTSDLNYQMHYAAFIIIILLIILTRKALASGIIAISQSCFWDLRKEILRAVLNTGYKEFLGEKISIQSSILQDVNTLTQASFNVIDFFTSIVLAVSCLVYLSIISFVLFCITCVFVIVGITVYHFRSQSNVKEFEKVRKIEDDFIFQFNSIINGFKEIYMEPLKGQQILNEKIQLIGNEAIENNTKAYKGFLDNQLIGQVLFYILISSILLFLSPLLKINQPDTIRFVFTLLYLLGAIQTIMGALPGFIRTKIAANRLIRLKGKLKSRAVESTVQTPRFIKSEFIGLSISNLSFEYPKENELFKIGPINFTVQKGDVVFIYGGNGSGKTTFLMSLTGIYESLRDELVINNVRIDNGNSAYYKAVFSIVFTDFYLFKEIIGIEKIDYEKLKYYLTAFELEKKVNIVNGAFAQTDLSTGQRKRLALILALLENKPIIVLDEWAADQDPEFRMKFYTQIIPLLKKEGFTVIAITHDDKYYYCADKLYKMEDGKLKT